MGKNQDTCFDLRLASECIEAFSMSTGLSVSIDDFNGNNLARCGVGCEGCVVRDFYEITKKKPADCHDVHLYGMLQAQRFGGKYIYFCPSGFSFIISPIVTVKGAVAYAKAGPFLMVDKEEYIRYDLVDLLKVPIEQLSNIEEVLADIPFISPEKATKLSTLLFMSIGFINSVKIYNEKLQIKTSDEIQGNISELLKELKAQSDEKVVSYPFEKENELICAIVDGDKQNSNRLLNDLFGYIFFCLDGEFEVIRTSVFELLVLISRAAVEGGADEEHIFSLNSSYFEEINCIKTLDELCLWLVEVMNRLIDYVFRFNDVKHVDIIRKSVDYIRRNYAKKITLEDVASIVYLSPSYFSKVFKDEMELNFNAYLNKIRIEKSKQLLMNDSIKLADVSGLVGFEDQSYFSKVFKKLVGQTPGKFRESREKRE